MLLLWTLLLPLYPLTTCLQDSVHLLVFNSLLKLPHVEVPVPYSSAVIPIQRYTPDTLCSPYLWILLSGPACWHQQTKTGVTRRSSDWPAPLKVQRLAFTILGMRLPLLESQHYTNLLDPDKRESLGREGAHELQGKKKSIKFHLIMSVLRI